MPRYDYICGNCNAEMELEHRMSEERRKCPTCGKLKLKKILKSMPAFHAHYSPMHPRAGRGRGGPSGLPGS